MKHLNLTHRPLAAALAGALALSACGGSDAPPPAFTLNTQVVTASLEQETLPYAGIVKAANINTQGRDDDAQIIYPFVGFGSSDGEGYSKIGNAKTGTAARMLARFYPNPKHIPAGTELTVYPVTLQSGRFYCLRASDHERLSLERLNGSVDRLPSGKASYVFDLAEVESCASAVSAASGPDRPLELAITMRQDQPSTLTWMFAVASSSGQWTFISQGSEPDYHLPPLTGKLAHTINAAAAPVHFNDRQRNALPANVTAFGNFRPANDGFGFANVGDGSFDLFSAEDIAKNFGQDTVCFAQDGKCVGLNPFGYYIKNNMELYQEVTPNGLCYGYAMASMGIHQQAFYDGKKYLSDYNPQATSAIELDYRDVKSMIANLFMSQASQSTDQHRQDECTDLLPSQAIERIEQRFNSFNPIAVLSIGILDPVTNTRSDGHAITPWAISDEGNGIKRIYVYDNNFPGDANRYITVNTQQETWSYNAKANASATEAEYTGTGTSNPMCPIPLSVGIEHSDIAIQAKGTTRFVDFSQKNSQVIDANGRISGGDLNTQTEINNIPGAELQSFVDHKALVIPVPETSDALTEIDRDNVQAHLDVMYTINAMSVDDNATQTFQVNQSTLLDREASAAYALTADMNQVSMSDVITFKAHASARIVTVERLAATQTQTVALQTFITLNTEQIGYSSQIEIDATQVSQDAVGFFVKDNGRDVVVFEYDPKDAAGTFRVIRPEAYLLELTQFNPDGTTELLTSGE